MLNRAGSLSRMASLWLRSGSPTPGYEGVFACSEKYFNIVPSG